MNQGKKALLTGWFSFEGMGATAGDLITRDTVGEWMGKAEVPFDVAVAPPFSGGVNWKEVDPSDYHTVVFVCGPFGNGWPVNEMLERFQGARFFGLNLSLLQSLDEWDPFDFLVARDSSAETNPDFSFADPIPTVPVVGVVKVHKQTEYGERGLHDRAHDLIDELLDSEEVARVEIDTRLDVNHSSFRTPLEVTSAIRKMDLVVTTRLHGTVLSLSQGVPALAIDPIRGGAKISRQAATIGWPAILLAETARIEDLREAFAYCRSEEARRKAELCTAEARKRVLDAGRRFRERLRAE